MVGVVVGMIRLLRVLALQQQDRWLRTPGLVDMQPALAAGAAKWDTLFSSALTLTAPWRKLQQRTGCKGLLLLTDQPTTLQGSSEVRQWQQQWYGSVTQCHCSGVAAQIRGGGAAEAQQDMALAAVTHKPSCCCCCR